MVSSAKGRRRDPILVHQRHSEAAQRTIVQRYTENAWAAIGRLEPGMELFGFSKGQFSLVQLVLACLAQTGPADVTVSTWTAARKEIETADRLTKAKAIRSLRWLVDLSFPRRQPQFAQQLREAFGDGCIRVTRNHAKFVLLRNEQWNLVVRTSMNLNSNPRFESWELSDDKGLADFLEGVVRLVFEHATPEEAWTERPGYHADKFGALGVEAKRLTESEAERLGATLDDPHHPGLHVM